MRRILPLRYGIVISGAALLLTGCVAHAPQPAPAQPFTATDLRTVDLTVSELRLAERHAYRAGFEAGRAYERRHFAATPAPITPLPTPNTTTPQTRPQPQPPEPQKQISPPANTPPITSSPPAYSASGPATPLSTAP